MTTDHQQFDMRRITEEIKAIKAPSGTFLISMLGLLASVSAAAYVLDGARAIAFGLFPAIALLTLSRNSGINREKTPALNGISWMLAIAIWVVAGIWVALHPA